MKTSDQLTSDAKLGLLLIGEPFSRKSSLALHFPDPWVCDVDNNLARLKHLLFMKNKKFWYDRVDVDDAGAVVDEAQRWLRFLAVTQAAGNDPNPKFLIFDSMTAIGHILERYVISQGSSSKDLVIGGVKSMTLQLWNPYKDLWLKLITAIRASQKHCIFICHRKVDKDEVSGTLDYKPMIGGQLADSVGRLFTDVWHCTTDTVMPTKDNPEGIVSIIETVPQPRMKQLGNSLDLPPRFRFDWPTLEAKLKEKGFIK